MNFRNNANDKMPTPWDVNRELEAISDKINISEENSLAALRIFADAAMWFASKEILFQTKGTVNIQGSFAIGTVVQPTSGSSEFDLDLFLSIPIEKSKTSMKELKEAAGKAIGEYAEQELGIFELKEGRRCWTMVTDSGAQFHTDVLPCLPDPGALKEKLSGKTLRSISNDAVSYTDKTNSRYKERTSQWPISNPVGFRNWFNGRQKSKVEDARIEAGGSDGTLGMPSPRVRTPLQRTVQLLKRHRDLVFSDTPEVAPISIIVTTVAANLYRNHGSVRTSLDAVIGKAADVVEERNGTSWIPNPSNPTENFADKWTEDDSKKRAYYDWVERLEIDLKNFTSRPSSKRQKNELWSIFGY